MKLSRTIAGTLLAVLLSLGAGSAAFAGSDSPTPYTVSPTGITLPEGSVFFDNQEVNISGDFGSRGIHLESKCVEMQAGPDDRPECFSNNNWGVSLHDMAQLIGQSFAPFSLFGLSGAYCVSWAQLGGYDPHYGEGGQPPVCSTVVVDKQVDICHRNQGSPEWVLITINDHALSAHLSHQWGEDIYPVPDGGCPIQPHPKVTYSPWVDESWVCEATETTQSRTKTVTPYVWNESTKSYVEDVANAVTTTETRTRQLKISEQYTCPIPDPPSPKIIYSEWVVDDWVCEATETTRSRTKTVIPYVLDGARYVEDTANAVTSTESEVIPLSEEEQYSCPVPDVTLQVPTLSPAPPTCGQDGSLLVKNETSFTWNKTGMFGPGAYQFVATAAKGSVFEAGPGVSEDGKTYAISVTVAQRLPVSQTCPVFSGDPPEELAFTGADSALALLAAGMVTLGAVLAFGSRRRHKVNY